MLILASGSPRRAEILTMLGYNFEIIPADCDESTGDLTADKAVAILAERKAQSVAESHPDCTVLGSDTLVTVDGAVLGKPTDAEDAARMLRLLSGRTHTVYTGVSVITGDLVTTECVGAKVTFRELSDGEIADYIATGEPMDKAGAYGIQGRGAMLIEGIEGDFFCVMGLPAAKTHLMLKKHID